MSNLKRKPNTAPDQSGSPFRSQLKKRFLVQAIRIVFALATIIATPLLAQNTTADVVGTVTDTTGAAIPNAKIDLTNVDTHETRTVTSGENGEYTFTLLKPSRYSLTISAPGFKSVKIDSIGLSAGDRAREDSHLAVGTQGEVINVEATTPALRTDSAALITTVTEKATQELPLNGRNFINLVQVTPVPQKVSTTVSQAVIDRTTGVRPRLSR